MYWKYMLSHLLFTNASSATSLTYMCKKSPPILLQMLSSLLHCFWLINYTISNDSVHSDYKESHCKYQKHVVQACDEFEIHIVELWWQFLSSECDKISLITPSTSWRWSKRVLRIWSSIGVDMLRIHVKLPSQDWKHGFERCDGNSYYQNVLRHF